MRTLIGHGMTGRSENPVKYLFIDGAYMERVLSDFGNELWDHGPLSLDFNRLGTLYDRVIYYDALPVKKHNETEEAFEQRFNKKVAYLDAIRDCQNCHVRDGITRLRKNAKNLARSQIEQKGVDTWLAIDALLYAFRGNIDFAEIVTGDADLYPLFEALLQTNTRSVLHYKGNTVSSELTRASDKSVMMTYGTLQGWLPQKIKAQFYQEDKQYENRSHPITLMKIENAASGACTIYVTRDGTQLFATFENIGGVVVAGHAGRFSWLLRQFHSDVRVSKDEIEHALRAKGLGTTSMKWKA